MSQHTPRPSNPFPCPECSKSDWRLDYYEAAYQGVTVLIGKDGKPDVDDYPGDQYGHYDDSGLDEYLRCNNCEHEIPLATIISVPPADARLHDQAPAMLALLADTVRRWDTDETSTDVMDDFVAEARAVLSAVEGDGK